jgi:hypothetical protein
VSDEQPILTRAQRRAIPIPLDEEQRALVQRITAELGEEKEEAVRQIEALVYHCGVEMAAATLEQALRVEAEGGLMIKTGKRRRTPGGVFLFLMSQQLTLQLRRETIYLYQTKPAKSGKKKKKKSDSEKPQPKAKSALLPWDFYRQYTPELSGKRGVATTVKITLIGRPGAIKIHQDTVMTTIEHLVKSASLPKGVPHPPTSPTSYTVYMGLKQWRKVENALQENPDDSMIIEGVCAFDAELQGMVVFANNTTTKGLEAAKREMQGQKASTRTPAPLPTMPEVTKYPIPPNVPPSVAQKLHDLYSAADQFRHKLAALDTLPPDQRLGYAMTQKLLKNTEDQIAALERQYK